MITFVDAFPLASCTEGGNGRTIMMIANQAIPQDVLPIFHVYVNGSHRPDLDHILVQPTKDIWPTTSVIRFPSPPQPYLKNIREGFMIKLTAKNLAGEVSDSRWDFQYVEHKKKEEGDLSGAGYSGHTGAETYNGQYQPNERETNGGRGNAPPNCIFCGGILD